MLKLFVFITCCAVACLGAPQASNTALLCGETPAEIFACLNTPSVVDRNLVNKCSKKHPGADECTRMTCLFLESGWLGLDGIAVDKVKIKAYFDQFEKDHAEMQPAVQQIKSYCLGNELKAQGIYLNCPAYDILQCVFASFIKFATPAQWSSSAKCANAHAYAGACPVCPQDCFAPSIPYGSCNACLTRPRSA